ncbi:MAG: tRNA uridine-5-carboxymethylaminomethyl(34) synthesis GTPase MnmE [Candidatus Melainabacteria bacterium RIFCSPLOWO2_02_FULL_35_15]|nr:MAG: tRNA uridine-5-carboxymethylaminomethyl(34) synthesis GTPase MnmE [Candidatus Melainabacteria bacterium RIFCSPLOWO2_12_FULL_35_11]OGI13790.1 MAG: tRNA uridine-5-carboxymethylaminomethyl(34) synthesis GTPase MnmE [Candidatus Melainabacteria bacterium RIFCSPLOWO2_02_FULL_35_15]
MFNLSDTICAICTPKGTGAIAAIRISGSDSWNIARKIFFPSSSFNHMHAIHGHIKDNEKIIDEVVLLPYKSPKSFTLEDTIEIFCHGGLQVTSQILDICLKAGARQAKNGEFTFRAFINGRIDLTEAEAINELISADNEKAVYVASEILSGSLKKKIIQFREKLFELITQIESSIEFPMDVPDTGRDKIVLNLQNIKNEINNLIESSKEGQILRDGIKISIIGPPNAGKSSLLNQLLESDRAIVSEEPGTTRDTIEEKIIIDGWPIVLIDTAGIREKKSISNSEKTGIERSKQAIQKSDIVLAIFDIVNDDHKNRTFTAFLENKSRIIIGNKIDLLNGKLIDKNKYDVLISAKNGTNIDKLKKIILEKIDFPPSPSCLLSPIHINQRQKELLIQCNFALENSISLANKSLSEDLISDELKNAVSKLDEISGRAVSDAVIQNIFAKFCIGK